MTFSFRIVIVLLSFPQFSKYFATADENGLELNSQSKFWEYIKEYSNRRDQNLYPRYGITKQGMMYYNSSNRSLIEQKLRQNGMIIYIFKYWYPSQWKLGTLE